MSNAGGHPSLTFGEIILTYICPALGTVTAISMCLAPVKSVQTAVKKGSIGALNPTPWAFMTGNCVGWLAYAFLTGNVFVFLSNAPGFMISVWLNLCAAKLIYQGHAVRRLRHSMSQVLEERTLGVSMNESQKYVAVGSAETDGDSDDRRTLTPSTSSDEEEEEESAHMGGESMLMTIWEKSVQLVTLEKAPVSHEILVVSIATLWMLVFALVSYLPITSVQRQMTVGIVVNVNLLFFYGAPLSTIVTVLNTRESSSIHVPTMITNTINGVFWTAYGLGIGDWLIALPNGVGAGLGIVQFALCILFPTHGVNGSKAGSTGGQAIYRKTSSIATEVTFGGATGDIEATTSYGTETLTVALGEEADATIERPSHVTIRYGFSGGCRRGQEDGQQSSVNVSDATGLGTCVAA